MSKQLKIKTFILPLVILVQGDACGMVNIIKNRLALVTASTAVLSYAYSRLFSVGRTEKNFSVYAVQDMSQEQKKECVKKNKEFLERYKKCRGCYLVGADFKNANLKNVDLYGADLKDADLQGADLQGSIITYVNLDNTCFNECTNLKGARIEDIRISGKDFSFLKASTDESTRCHFLPSDQSDPRIIALKADQYNKKKKLFNTMQDTSITKLYKLPAGQMYFYMSKEEIKDSGDKNLKKIFDRPEFMTIEISGYKKHKKWTDEQWSHFKEALIYTENNKRGKQFGWDAGVHIDEAAGLLHHAKTILKSFIPSDGTFDSDDQLFIKENFIDKGLGIHRLFVFTKLQKVIEEKKLHHVRLPLKLLVIRDLRTGNYIIGQKALKIIDNTAKLGVRDSGAEGEIELDSDYEFVVLANREDRCGAISESACRDLENLAGDAPFDVGYDNIFGSNGDAVIIDTEFKGTCASDCIPKLVRYGCRCRLLENDEKQS